MNEARHLDLDTLNALVDDAIPEAERPGIMEHLAGCTECRQELAELRATARLCAALPQFIPPHAFTLGPEFDRQPGNPRLIRMLPVIRSLAVAALLVFVLVSAFAVINTRPSSASSPASDLPVQQSRANMLAPASVRSAPAGTNQPATVLTAAPTQPAPNGHSLSPWWVASLVVGLGATLLLLSWFALARGGLQPRGRLFDA